MRIAYLIMAHNNLKHLKRLVAALNSDDVTFFVHIDRKVKDPPTFDEYGNVKLIEHRLDVKWAGYSQVEATLSLLETAFNSDTHDYYVLLSGVDYPIKSNQFIRSFFVEHNGKSFMSAEKMPSHGKTLDRLYKYYIEGARQDNPVKMWSIRSVDVMIRFLPFKRNPPKEYSHYVPYAGSTWWAFHRESAQYLIEYHRDNPTFFNYYEHTACPDEMIFHTIIMNSPHRSTIEKGLTYDDWSVGKPPYPSLIKKIHLSALRQETIHTPYGSTICLFARKFDDNSVDIIKEIETIRDTWTPLST